MAITEKQRSQKLKPDDWWRRNKLDPPLAEHLIDKLVAAGLTTVGEVVDAGPAKLRALDGIGAGAVDEIGEWLCTMEDGKPAPAPQAEDHGTRPVSQPRAVASPGQR